MRASRLVSILSLLQTRERMTARQLAEAVEVSVRTIYRDMDSLAAAGIPVYAEPGHDGGYRLVGGYRTRLTGLTADEARTLFLTGLPDVAADLGFGGAVTAAQRKLLAALPAQLSDEADRFSRCFHLDAPSWYADADDAPQLRAVSDAVWDRRRIRIRYLRWEAPQQVSRTVEPLGLVLKAGHWYLVAHSSERIRTYRVSRIADVEITEEEFTAPQGFDLREYWSGYLADFNARRFQDEARIRLSPSAFESFPHVMEAAVAQAALNSRTAADARGWVSVTVPIESYGKAALDFLGFGDELEVLAPERLRAEIAGTVAALHRRYRGGGCAGGD